MTARSFHPIESSSSSVPLKSKRRRSRPKQSIQPEHRWLVSEIVLKLGFNGILAVGAIAALVRLLPYQQVQQVKLHEVQMQVQETERRVSELRNKFNRNFDPQQIRKIMEEQSPRLDPNQRNIFLTNP
ncbi:MAG: hypothetical protein VKJ02_12995 [Snowella sp.]|nr:hypothetical protein [Snowella sp.]